MLKFLYHTDCLNISKAWSDQHEIADRDRMFRAFHGWLNLPPALVALPLTILFIAASIRAIRAHRVSRKFNALLINRALGDLSAIAAALIISFYVFLAEHVDSHWIQFLNTFFQACFWSGLVTYTSIGFLKLYGIANPLKYKEKVTMSKCLLLIKLSWLFFLLIMSITMGFTLVVKIELLADWTGCKAESCLSWMYKVRNTFTLLLYAATILFFAISVFLIKKAKRRAKSLYAGKGGRQQRSVRKRFKFPLIKLTIGVSTFAIFHLPYAVFMCVLMIANGCYFLLHYNAMQSLLGLIRFFVLLRIILDNLLGFAMDPEIRRQLFALLSPIGRRGPKISESGGKSASRESQRAGMKLSTTTNSVVISSESPPESYESVVEEAERENGQKRTESTKMSPKSSGQIIQPKRFSDRTDYKNKRVKF